jgi:hypothetical protein
MLAINCSKSGKEDGVMICLLILGFDCSNVDDDHLLVEIDLYLSLCYLILETNRSSGRFDKGTLWRNQMTMAQLCPS